MIKEKPVTSPKAPSKKKPVKAKRNRYFGNMALNFVFILFLVALGAVIFYSANTKPTPKPVVQNPLVHTDNDQLVAFASVDDFKDYLAKSSDFQGQNYYSGVNSMMRGSATAVDDMMAPTAAVSTKESTSAVDRVSTTNVQVAGIDEPDIVKTDGNNIYFSPEQYFIYQGGGGIRPLMMEKMMPPIQASSKTSIIKALPVTDAAVLSKIEKSGNLLLKDKILVIFSGQEIIGYDISDPSKAAVKWNINLDNNTFLVSARQLDDRIYLVTQSNLNSYTPCPLKLLASNDQAVSLDCNRIYHPLQPMAIDANFSAIALDFASGEVKNKISFLGNSGQSLVYMSPQSLYITYQQQVDSFTFAYNFLSEKMQDLVPAVLTEKLNKIRDYDISQSSKMTEFYTEINKWQSSLSQDEQLKFQTEMQNRLTDYLKDKQRELLNTGIAKIALSDFKINGVGSVPGVPLNQFSLDEYQNNLRIATTIGNNWWVFGGNSGSSTNDLYVLDKKMKTIGSIQDLGMGERIYAARFMGDRGYLVTYKQTDPFYVLDLSDASHPQKKGELKIPGFSSYLHPLADNIILGVGMENNKVKLSLFNVSDPQNPTEIDHYNLDEYWTDVSNNHHAFLQDEKFKVFFIPGSQGGYIFSYENNKLSLYRTIALGQIKRVVYVNDNFYALASGELRIYDENTWKELKQVDLTQ